MDVLAARGAGPGGCGFALGVASGKVPLPHINKSGE